MCLCFVNDDRKWRGHLTGTPPIKSARIIRYCRPGVRLPYDSDGDARRLALGLILRILVTLRVFEMDSHYICPFRYRLGLCIKKFTKNALTLTTQKSPLEFSLSLSHAHIGLPWGFNWNFPPIIPVTFLWESPWVLYVLSSFCFFSKYPAGNAHSSRGGIPGARPLMKALANPFLKNFLLLKID